MKKKNEKSGLFGSIFNESDFDSFGGDDYSLADGLRSGSFSSPQDNGSNLFLNRYSLEDMVKILKKTGMIKHLSSKGFPSPVFEIFRDEQQTHYFKIFNEKIDPSNILIDLRLSEKRYIPKNLKVDAFRDVIFDMFAIEWLQTQNISSNEFTVDRPQLPGQRRPGLGGLKYLMLMMQDVAPGITIDGFLDVPDHFHLAVMYTKKFKFFDPVIEGKMIAVLRDMEGHTLSDITWGVMTQTIKHKKTGEPFTYEPAEEVFPISARCMKYFNHKSYVKQYKESLKNSKYIFDASEMLKKKEEILASKDISEL